MATRGQAIAGGTAGARGDRAHAERSGSGSRHHNSRNLQPPPERVARRSPRTSGPEHIEISVPADNSAQGKPSQTELPVQPAAMSPPRIANGSEPARRRRSADPDAAAAQRVSIAGNTADNSADNSADNTAGRKGLATAPALVASAVKRLRRRPRPLRSASSGLGNGHRGSSSRDAAGTEGADGSKLGMFQGVIMPTCANMWGVLIFLRFNTIVSYAGVGQAMVIATLAYSVALLTTLSLSAIATSHSPRAGGVFPMLSRALGREIATAIALMYALGITLGAVLECLGACEVWLQLDPVLDQWGAWGVQLWGSVFMASLALLVLGGMQLVSQLGLAFFAVTLCTLLFLYVSLFGAPSLEAVDAPAPHPAAESWDLGLSAAHMRNNLGAAYADGQSFSSNLALFFPCFTGFLSGANRASSLRDPARGIPYGTLGGITISYVLYISIMLLWGAVGPRLFLRLPTGALDAIIWPAVTAVRIGIVTTSLGQALQNLVVAPLLLQSVAQEGVLRVLNPFAVRHAGEPKRALLFAYIVGALCVLIGSLDLVAPLLSMCFLLCYASMNMTCFVLDWLKDPSWRPKWRYFHWSSGLAGCVLCVSLMLAINFVYAIVAWSCAAAIIVYILRTSAETDWGSALYGLRFKLAMRSLATIDMQAHLETAWCPQVLLVYQLQVAGEGGEGAVLGECKEVVERLYGPGAPQIGADGGGGGGAECGSVHLETSMAGDRLRGPHPSLAEGHTHKVMISLADQLRKGQGLTIAAAVVPLLPDEGMSHPDVIAYGDSERKYMQYLFKRVGLQGFAMVVPARDPLEGRAFAIQCAGLGPLTPNTVVMGWPWWWRSRPMATVPPFVETIHQCTRLQKAVLLGHNLTNFPTDDSAPMSGTIDVWWIKHDGGLLLLLANLLRKHRLWRRCQLRLHLVTDSRTDPEVIRARMLRLLAILNIDADVGVVVNVHTDSMLPYMRASEPRVRNQELAFGPGADTMRTDEVLFSPEATDSQLGEDEEEGKLRAAVQAAPRWPWVERVMHDRPGALRRASMFAAASYANGHDDHAHGVGSAEVGPSPASSRATPGAHPRTPGSATSGHGSGTNSGANSPEPLAVPRRSLRRTVHGALTAHRLVHQARVEMAAAGANWEATLAEEGLRGATESPPGARDAARDADAPVDPPPSPTPPRAPPREPPATTVSPADRDGVSRATPSAPHPGPGADPDAGGAAEGAARRQPPSVPPPAILRSSRRDATAGVGGADMCAASEERSGVATAAQPPGPPQAGVPTRAAGAQSTLDTLLGDLETASAQLDQPARASPGPPAHVLERPSSVPRFRIDDVSHVPESVGGLDASWDSTSPPTKRAGVVDGDDPRDRQSETRAVHDDEDGGWEGESTTWEEMHRKILERSADAQLVIVNMPDPPEAERSSENCDFTEVDVSRMVAFMEYMEGLAGKLPRVIFVHGAGQEIIRFDII